MFCIVRHVISQLNGLKLDKIKNDVFESDKNEQ